MSARDPDDGDGKTARRNTAPSVGDDIGLEPTSVRRSSPEPLERTTVRAVSSVSDPLIGQLLGEYRVLAPLGQGGMGIVYRGEQPVIGRPVAIKVLKREFAQDPAHARRFLEEARSVSAARHPGIIDVFSFGETPAGEPYLVMELLEGEALDVLIHRKGTLTPKETIALLIPMLNALSAAHAAGVIHRDLKPGNVFVVRLHDGTTFPKLLDFGLARRGEVGERVRQTSVGGTPLYIAPEQARGEALGPQADLYSLGCLAYEALVGRPPFFEGNLHELLDQHATLAPKPLRPQAPAISAALEKLVLQLLEKDPAKRPASALVVREQLERMRDEAVAPTRVRPAQRPSRPVEPVARTAETPALTERTAVLADRPTPADLPAQPSRRPWVFALVGLLALSSLAAAFAFSRERQLPPPERPSPRRPAPIPLPEPVEAPAPEPEPVVEKPEPPVETPKLPAPVRTPRANKHTARDVKERWRTLKARANELPDDLRRAANLQLEEARFCTGAPEQCWRDLSDIEKTFFP